jgi:hypothetical protein
MSELSSPSITLAILALSHLVIKISYTYSPEVVAGFLLYDKWPMVCHVTMVTCVTSVWKCDYCYTCVTVNIIWMLMKWDLKLWQMWQRTTHTFKDYFTHAELKWNMWQGGTKWPGDEMTRGRNDRLRKWPGDKMTGTKWPGNKWKGTNCRVTKVW